MSPGARPVNGNLEALPFRSGSFDVVMSRGALPAIANPALAVRELLRVCKPGGLLYFYTYRHGWYDVVLNGVRKVALRLGAPACSRPIYAVCRRASDPRVATMIWTSSSCRFATHRRADRAGLAACARVRFTSIQPVVHAQFGEIELPVDRRTAWLHRVLPKNGVVSLRCGSRSPSAAVAGAGRVALAHLRLRQSGRLPSAPPPTALQRACCRSIRTPTARRGTACATTEGRIRRS